jgi:hypothetical protein
VVLRYQGRFCEVMKRPRRNGLPLDHAAVDHVLDGRLGIRPEAARPISAMCRTSR